jgi:hypothetical protein
VRASGGNHKTCGDCKHWHAEGHSPYGTCVAPIPRWVFEWVAGQWLSLVLEVPRLWCREYEADDCEAFEEGSS